MTLPRPVIPGHTEMITRRCTQRQFLLRPSKKVNQILLYCLAVAAERYGILLHAFCFLSNHYHLIETDVRGNRPEFCRWLHEFIAKCVNAHYGRWENLWSSEQTSVVHLVDGLAQIRKALYTLSNSVSSRLVPHSYQWPGVCSRPEDVGKEIKIKRPKGFFAKDGELPKVATLRLTKLPALAHLPDDQYGQKMRELIQKHEANIRQRIYAEGHDFLGRKAILQQDPTDSPRSFARRRQMSPRISCSNKWARIEALQRISDFVKSYARALELYLSGQHDATFPHGTYWLARYVGVHCAPAG